MKLALDPAVSLPQAGAGKTDDPANRNDPEALRAICQDFESILIQSMFKEMRKTIPESELLDTGMASDLFDEMMDMEVARDMARKGGFGLADQLYRQLQGTGEGSD
ncbi:flagellar protein FlgJ [Desulfosalsimonas propionicica]|uniref:Flagellar protein FlgJ n=1 Tax=Desulfosalsimonas propionicica TaxID=332175 RepID=A0A7W0C8Y1_9BACT|nr:rod-binding protein [Desulfosalsimonas propionicica]MBA2881326.1 flagellar protein FlgJ [Desulfosalsimonas propionicica]